MILHYNITVTGKVQGVGYRIHTKKQAQNLGVCGWVCNMKNGDVYIEAEASPSTLEKFIHWCKTGPLGAHVDHVTYVEKEVKRLTNFYIRTSPVDLPQPPN